MFIYPFNNNSYQIKMKFNRDISISKDQANLSSSINESSLLNTSSQASSPIKDYTITPVSKTGHEYSLKDLDHS